MDKYHIVRIEFLGILLLGSFRLSIDGKEIGQSTFRKGCTLTSWVSPGKHILSAEIWPYWLSFLTKKEFPFEIERDVEAKDYRLSYSRFWGKFSNLIVTNTVYWKEKSDKKDDTMLQSPYQTLPPSATPPDTIPEEKTQESHSDENILESEKAPEVEESSMRELEKLIERRNAGEMTSEDFDEAKKKILERKPQYNKELDDVQEEFHSDDMIEEEIKDGVVSKSNVGAGGDDKFSRLEKLTEMKEKGLIDDDEFKQMKKEILGK
jgi:hypothetical protein